MNRLLLSAFVLALLAPPAVFAAEEDLADEAAAGPADDLLKGGSAFRLVKVKNPEEAIAPKIYWRRFQNTIAAQTTPVRFLLDNVEVIAPRKVVDKATKEIRTLYPSEGRKDIANGKHLLLPGELAITMDGGKITAAHPAIRVAGQDVLILCTPVRFEAIDSNGMPAPIAIKITCGKEPLLRETANFNPLIVWLPVGLKYTSTFGTFSLGADGKLTAETAELAPRVKLVADPPGLTLSVDAAQSEIRRGENTRVIQHVPGEGKKPITCFVEPLLKPGEPARIAISKKQFAAATKAPFVETQFSFAISPSAALPKPVHYAANLTSEPSPEYAQAASRALNTDLADLGWFNLPLPKPMAMGALSYVLSAPLFGNLHGTFIVADPTTPLQILPHRMRSVFSDNEEALYTVFVKSGFAGGEAKVLCRAESADAKPIELGKIALPAVTEHFDSRMFIIKTRELPGGTFSLWIESAAGASPKTQLTIVPWARRSSFLVHSMAACGGMWPSDDAGLKLLQSANMEMVCNGGFGSEMNTDMPGLDPRATHWLKSEGLLVPPEAAERTTANDLLLERLLSHQVRLVDFNPRGQNMYMEGLSYHHSFKPTVDRMIRRLQVFTQQTADYPSFWGINYTWFPSLFGYAEGGVDTDIHKRDRNAALAENLQKAGFTHLTAEERKFYDENKFSDDADKRAKALQLMQRAVAHWKAQQDFGFGRHNKLYNDAVRQIRPDAVCTLYENAGHDEHKRTRNLFGDMDAATYESYSDYPEWPMSASFTTDWARGNFPGRPVWITIDPGTSSEGMMKSLFHAFGRGAGGAGTLMPEDSSVSELQRRSKGLRFVSQYGAIPTHAIPDGRCAILSTAAEQILNPEGRTQYNYHAMYYHLTRLGFPPAIIDDEDAANSGIPDNVKALFIVRQRQPLESKVAGVVDAFIKKGGTVFVTGDSQVKVPGAIVIDKPIKNIWMGAGFQPKSHAEMWEHFETVWRTPLTDALAKASLAPAASTDPDRGLVVCLDAGAIRYAVVMADEKGEPFSTFKASVALPVSLEGTGWQVRDLARQEMLKKTEKEGRTLVSIDFVNEPATVLALYKTPPLHAAIKIKGTPKLGGELIFTSEISAAKDGAPLGPLPVQYEWVDPTGRVRNTIFRAAGDEARLPLPALDLNGNWKLNAQELLTGVTATLELNLTAPQSAETITAVPDVHVVNSAHVSAFFKHAGEKRVVIEAGQERLLPLAQKLVADLSTAGIQARLWKVKPEDFDTIPVRWYPRADEDVPRLKAVDEGNLIGWRENMKAFIDTQKRAHIPEKGGYGEIEPLLMVGVDCIVFSGGQIANELRAVTPWMDTPTVPGKAQGRIVACFSPFTANHHALAIVGNDIEGLTKAASRAVAFTKEDKPVTAAQTDGEWKIQSVAISTRPVPQPFVGYTPVRRVTRLLATREGKAVVCLEGKKDTRAFVDASGKVTATVASESSNVSHSMIDNDGRCWEFTSKHLGGEWYNQEISLRCIATDGTLLKDLSVYNGSVFYTELPTDWEGAFPVAPNGSVGGLGVLGGMLFGKYGDAQWVRYDDVPNAFVRDAIRHPRFPVGAVFSPDSKYVLTTLDTRPPGWGGMNWPAEHPSACETVLLDVATGKPVWRLRDDKNIRKTTYAVHTGFGAVAKDGNISAFADYLGSVYLVDKTGKIVLQQQVATQLPPRYSRGPLDGIGVWMNDAGTLSAFGYKNLLLLSDGKSFARVPVAQLVSACVSNDGARAVAALESGEVKAFDPSGNPKWAVSPGGIAPRVAAIGADQTLVATSLGDLVLLDAAGKEIRRTPISAEADREKHELKQAAQYQHLSHPLEYLAPETLDIARKELAAQQVAVWKPTVPGAEVFGKSFFKVDAPITLSAADSKEKEFFVHLVYRRPAENKSLTITSESKEGSETFALDLSTPEFRVVDIPIRGAGAKMTLTTSGPVEIAECSLWSFRWPGANIAFVQPAKSVSSGLDTTKEGAGDIDGLLGELDGGAGLQGKMKQCKIWSPNPDVDKIAGPYLKPGIDALQMVDGKRFGNGKLPAWNKEAFVGCWLTIDFGKPTPIKFVSTYDRAQKQSDLSANIAVFSAGTTETVRAGTVQNDQFWRIYSLTGEKMQTLGVHIYSGKADGLSEVEAYQSK
jgi:outer membrane protein assembly factor BamB